MTRHVCTTWDRQQTRDASALASRSCSSDAIFESFKNIYPAKRWYTLNGASLVRVPPQLYEHKSGERELPHCSERPQKTERKAWMSHCDRLAIGAAAATPWGTKPRYDRQTKLQPEQTEKQRNAETESGDVTRLNHLGFKQTPLILRERGEYYLSAGVNVLHWNSSQWATAQRVDVDHESLLWQLLNLQAGPLHRKDQPQLISQRLWPAKKCASDCVKREVSKRENMKDRAGKGNTAECGKAYSKEKSYRYS